MILILMFLKVSRRTKQNKTKKTKQNKTRNKKQILYVGLRINAQEVKNIGIR